MSGIMSVTDCSAVVRIRPKPDGGMDYFKQDNVYGEGWQILDRQYRKV